jgi:acetoacetyl-CoA synthetase
LHEGERGAAGAACAQERRLDRLAAPARGLPLDYENVKDDVWLFSTSGGTDLCTAFVGAAPILPSTRASCRRGALGAKVEAWNEAGHPLVNEVGELVITRPMPSMPLYFWNDPDGERYRSSYFEMFPGVWRHGDWIKITDRGTAVIYGRSDSTINRGGVRMGTSEIYSAVEGVEEVLDSLVVDVEDEMILFVVVRDQLTDEVVAEIRRRIRSTARHGTCRTASCRSRTCRARSRTRSSRCR